MKIQDFKVEGARIQVVGFSVWGLGFVVDG